MTECPLSRSLTAYETAHVEDMYEFDRLRWGDFNEYNTLRLKCRMLICALGRQAVHKSPDHARMPSPTREPRVMFAEKSAQNYCLSAHTFQVQWECCEGFGPKIDPAAAQFHIDIKLARDVSRCRGC